MSTQPTVKIDSFIKSHDKRKHDTYEFLTYIHPEQFKCWKWLSEKNNVISYVHLYNRKLSLRTYGLSTRHFKADELYHVSVTIKVQDRTSINSTSKRLTYKSSDPVGAQITIRNKENSKDYDSLPRACISLFNHSKYINYYDYDKTIALIILRQYNNKNDAYSQIIHIYKPYDDSSIDPNNSKVSKKTITHDFLTYVDPKICNNISVINLNRFGVTYCYNKNPNIIINSFIGDLTERFYDQTPILCRIKLIPKTIFYKSTKLCFYEKIKISFHHPDQDKGDYSKLPFRILDVSMLKKSIHSFNISKDKYLKYLTLMSLNSFNSVSFPIYLIKLSNTVSDDFVKGKYAYANSYIKDTWIHYKF